jgi:hypothetical protein
MRCFKYNIKIKQVLICLFILLSIPAFSQEIPAEYAKSLIKLQELSTSMIQTFSNIEQGQQVKSNLLKLIELSDQTKSLTEQLSLEIRNSEDEKLKLETASELKEIIRESDNSISHANMAMNAENDDFGSYHIDFLKSSVNDVFEASNLLHNDIKTHLFFENNN